jgi:hypothetical protein
LDGKYILEELDVDERIILKMIRIELGWFLVWNHPIMKEKHVLESIGLFGTIILK